MTEEIQRTKGTNIMDAQAEAGLKLFAAKEKSPVMTDLDGAKKYKAECEAKIADLEAQAALLTGKDNKKERSGKGKEVMNVKNDTKYIDACKVVKGLDPKNGFFVIGGGETQGSPEEASAAQVAGTTQTAEADAKKKKEKPKKELESAGLSPEEKKELESLKEKIVARKADLKAQGMSGGQQNKDLEIVQWVTRMNELKEKEEPGSTQKEKKKDEKKSKNVPLTAEEQKELDNLRGEIDTYKHKLKVEFGYSNKDMKADEDLKEMEARLAALEKRA